MRRYGCNRDGIDADRVVEIEPAFADVRGEIAGATYTAEDESGDSLNSRRISRTCANDLGRLTIRALRQAIDEELREPEPLMNVELRPEQQRRVALQ
jgi:hypothetical protein